MHAYKFSAERIREIGARLLEIQEILHKVIPTTLWVSDLHGEGEKFVKVLRGRFGMLYTTCQETLSHLNDNQIKQVSRLIRNKQWSPDCGFSQKQALGYLIKLAKYKTGEGVLKNKLQTRSLSALLIKTWAQGGIPDPFIEQEDLFNFAVRHLCETILQNVPDHIVLLGDLFDRGPSPDKIIRALNLSFWQSRTSVIWGNHDVLWFGAAAGGQSLIAETMRITFRYGHTAFLDRLKIDYKELTEFAQDVYPPQKVTGNFKAKDPLHRSIEKALAMIQFKLEEATIAQHPEWEMEHRLWLNKLAAQLKNNEFGNLTDRFFPTLDLDNPQALSTDEKFLINNLQKQWTQSTKLKRLMQFFVSKAKMFDSYQGLLNMHALIPSNPQGEFENFLGYKGKALLDFFQSTIDRVGQRYMLNNNQEKTDLDLLFYLWCGPKSPLFGKNAMKTFERYFLKDKATHKELSLHWEKNLKNPKFQQAIKEDFQVTRVIYGHTPRDITKGDKLTTDDGFGINIDGGFAGAYLNRGHALVRTPKNLYGIILPTEEEADQILSDSKTVPLTIEMVDQLEEPLLIKDLSDSDKLQKEWDELIEEMKQLTKMQYKNFFQASDEY